MDRERLLYRALSSVYSPSDVVLEKDLKETNPGTVYNALYKGKTKVVVKTQLADNMFDEVLHEGITGLYAINNLRPLTRCFSMVHSVYFNVDKSIVIYDRVEGKTLFDHLGLKNQKRVSDAKQILLTLLIGLNIAHHQIDFTHYDLHSNNVIVRTLSVPMPVTNGCKRLFTTRLLPVIIDYGRCHVKIGGQSYGAIGFESDDNWDKMFVKPIGFWQHDVFNILSMYYQMFDRKAGGYITDLHFDALERRIKNLKDESQIKYWQNVLNSMNKSKLEFKENFGKYERNVVEEKQFARVIERLIAYFVPQERFNYTAIIDKIGRFSHLIPDEHNQSLKFDDFLEYAISLVKIN